MKAFLMYRDRDFDLQQELPWNEPALTQDLELDTLFNAMALGDRFLFEVAKKAILTSLSNDLDTIRYRQNILKDCLKNPSVVRDLYDIAVETIEIRKKRWLGIFSYHHPASILHGAVNMLQVFMNMLRKLRKIADEHGGEFESEGFTAFFAMLNRELSDDYFAVVQNHLKELRFRDGVLISAELRSGNVGDNYILRKPQEKQSWTKQILAKKASVYTFRIANRDDSGTRALSELKDRGINLAANALARSADHILSFFNMLRPELGFYVGCLNLYERLAQMGEPVSFPLPVASSERRHSFDGLYDVCLALTMKQKIVGNDVRADDKDLVIITGANQGGKSTFLRSIGLAQLMMQSGMFVPAESSFCANMCSGLFTHYKREEDTTMESGKFDEELGRMSDIVDNITPDSIVLLNESFAATNEREGSEIARQIVSALLEKRIKVFFVTHLYQFAHSFHDREAENAMFLRAERQTDGGRTFRIIEGKPMQTSYGEDVYTSVFGADN